MPVHAKGTLLVTEERILSIMLWIAEAIPADSRWYPVFQRYLQEIGWRVTVFGGDPRLNSAIAYRRRKEIPLSHRQDMGANL